MKIKYLALYLSISMFTLNVTTIKVFANSEIEKKVQPKQKTPLKKIEEQPKNELDKTVLQAGKHKFEHYCSECHGMTGLGDGPTSEYFDPAPRNFTKDPFKYGSKREEMFKTISEGVKKTGMPAWGKILKPVEINNIIDYIKSLKK